MCLVIPADFHSLLRAWILKEEVFLFIYHVTIRVKMFISFKRTHNHLQRPHVSVHIHMSFCSFFMCYSGLGTQWFLLRRRTHPIGRRVRPNVPQRLWEGGKATQRGAAATEGAGATEGDWWKRKVWPNLLIILKVITLSGQVAATGLVLTILKAFCFLFEWHLQFWVDLSLQNVSI